MPPIPALLDIIMPEWWIFPRIFFLRASFSSFFCLLASALAALRALLASLSANFLAFFSARKLLWVSTVDAIFFWIFYALSISIS